MLIVAAIAAQYSFAQLDFSRKFKEVGVFIGASNFLGDLGGSSQMGRPFINDLDIEMTRPAIGAFYRVNFDMRNSVRANLYWAILGGNDKLAEPREMFADEWFRYYRNLHFRTGIIEASLQYEFNILNYEPTRRRFRFSPYLFFGVGGFYFNPKAKYTDPTTGETSWVALQPLGTEGQGLEEFPDRKKYSRIAISFPMGFGFKYAVNRYWNLGFEIGHRITTTDYVDDVSRTYPVYDFYEKNYDPETAKIAKDISRRSDEIDPGGLFQTITGPLQQRGDPADYDHYTFIGAIVVVMNIKGGRVVYPRL